MDKLQYFKKNKVNSSKLSLPNYFLLAIMGEEYGDEALVCRLKELLRIVELIEEEKRPEQAGKLIENEEKTSKNTEIIPNEKPENIDKSIDGHVNKMPLNSIEKVNGKKCFYNSKGMCLFKRSLCNIYDMPCENFVGRNKKELLKEEDSCRNFIKYMRKGRIQRVECSISGLPGCVGPDDCKFCLKKKGKR